MLTSAPACAAALLKLRSNHATRSNNGAIWQSARPLHVRMPRLRCVAHRDGVSWRFAVRAIAYEGRSPPGNRQL